MLDINSMKNDILMRCEDLRKLINGSRNELTTLQNMSETITTKQACPHHWAPGKQIIRRAYVILAHSNKVMHVPLSSE